MNPIRTWLALALALSTSPAFAQANYPDKPVRFIVGFTAGSATDITARLFAAKFAEAWNVPVTVENVPGAGGSVGGDRVAKSAPDGTTFYWGANGALTINPTLQPSARRLLEIQGRLKQLNAACVFAEPQFEPALVETVIEGTGARKGVLDPLGADLEPGPEQYFQLMYRLADSLVDCLGAGAK